MPVSSSGVGERIYGVTPILDFKYYKQELDRQELFATDKRAGICYIIVILRGYIGSFDVIVIFRFLVHAMFIFAHS